ncbi:hypothetical protein [Arthrobacter sp. R4-81]
MPLIEQIDERVGAIDIAVLTTGGVQHKPVLDGALVTMDNAARAQFHEGSEEHRGFH